MTELREYDSTATLVTELRIVTADLGAYIEKRAEEVAAPLIQAAEAAADAKVRKAEGEARHWKGVVDELRRNVNAALKSQHTTLHEAGKKHDPTFCQICKKERGETK